MKREREREKGEEWREGALLRLIRLPPSVRLRYFREQEELVFPLINTFSSELEKQGWAVGFLRCCFFRASGFVIIAIFNFSLQEM